MKKHMTFLVCIFLICTCLFSGVAAASEADAGDSNKWDMLIENLAPLHEDQVEDVAGISEDLVEPKVSAELAKAIEEADPLSAVSYDLRTGEVSLKLYEPSEKNDIVETTPSHEVSEDNIEPHLASDNRTRIYSVTTFPYRAIVQVRAYFNNGKTTLSGAGAMVGTKAVFKSSVRWYPDAERYVLAMPEHIKSLISEGNRGDMQATNHCLQLLRLVSLCWICALGKIH